mmetsp:Transcript_36324/g.103879  ORF Transcript_36324/g.103879 Transcript_36324/m.103879 type:complete len:287 (+) Transcript_36324:396-1256(+)
MLVAERFLVFDALSLRLFRLELCLDDAVELVPLGLCLCAQPGLFFRLLSQAGVAELAVHGLQPLLLLPVLLAGCPLGVRRGPLGPHRVHLGRLVLSLLLQPAEPGRLPLLGRGGRQLPVLLLPLSALLGLVVLEDLLLLEPVCEDLVLLDLHRRGVDGVHLVGEALRGQLLLPVLLRLLRPECLDLSEDERALLVSLILFAISLGLPVLDLLYDHLGAAALLLEALPLAHLVRPEGLEPVDLHHRVQALLLLLLLGLQHRLLGHLRVSDSDHLRHLHQLVEVFHVV